MQRLRFTSWLLLASAAAGGVSGVSGVSAAVSADCRLALDAMHSEEAALMAGLAGQSPELKRREALRRLGPLRLRAAKACLGGLPATPPPSQHTVQPAIVVPPIRLPAALPRAATPAPLPPPVIRPTIPATPTTLTTCDPAGCTASDGTRLQRAGSHLIGPRGLCTVQGTLLLCP